MKEKIPLAERIRKEGDLAELTGLVRQNNVGIITVHPFYARHINEKTYYNHADMLKQEYFDYEKDVVEFLSCNQHERKSFHIFENTMRSIDSAANAFNEYKRHFAWQEEPLYSPDGKILDMTSAACLGKCEKEHTLDGLEMSFAIKKNIETNALKRLENFLKEKDGVLLVGIFENFCLQRAKVDIEKMAKTLIGMDKGFFVEVNKLLTREFEKIVKAEGGRENSPKQARLEPA
ncbi:MAG: hypothetical protein WC506_05835 [Candidatus Micrarchaeia archaeon]